MTINTNELLADLVSRTRRILSIAKSYSSKSLEELNWRPAEKSWSVLECLEHLNRYGDFYLPEIEKAVKTSKYSATVDFQPGWLGNKFAAMMLPGENGKKMKTFKSKNPLGNQLGTFTLERFIDQQEKTLELLEKAGKVDLGRTKTAVSITPLLKLKLGDTLRVVIFHNERHIVQAERVLLANSKERTRATSGNPNSSSAAS